MIAYILSLNNEQLQSMWQKIDFGQRNSITANDQLRKLMVLMVDSYIESQMNATDHFVTTSLTQIPVDKNTVNTHEDDGHELQKTLKPSVILDCNEMA